MTVLQPLRKMACSRCFDWCAAVRRDGTCKSLAEKCTNRLSLLSSEAKLEDGASATPALCCIKDGPKPGSHTSWLDLMIEDRPMWEMSLKDDARAWEIYRKRKEKREHLRSRGQISGVQKWVISATVASATLQEKLPAPKYSTTPECRCVSSPWPISAPAALFSQKSPGGLQHRFEDSMMTRTTYQRSWM